MRRFIGPLFILFLISCGGGGGSSSGENTAPSPPPPTTSGCSVTVEDGPFTEVWPGLSWETATPESQGMCPDEINEAIDYAFQEGNYTGAVVIIKNGLVVAERYADTRMASDLVTSWSVAKSFTSALVGVSLDEGLIDNLDQRVSDFISAWQGTEKGSNNSAATNDS